MAKKTHYDVGGIQIVTYTRKVKNQILICIHGFGGDAKSSVIDALGKNLADDGVVVVAFDLPCHGLDKTGGLLSLEKCSSYLERVEEWVRTKFKGLPVSYFATSFGGYLLLHYLESSTNDYSRLILRAPAVNMKDIMTKIIIEHGKTLEDIEKGALNLGFEQELMVDNNFRLQLTLPKTCKNSENYFYILQGKLDELVDWKENEKYFETNFKNKFKFFYFDDADHRFKKPGQLERIIETTKQILK